MLEIRQFDEKEVKAWKDIIAPNAPDHIIKLVLRRCEQLGCDPAAKLIYAVNRKKGGASGLACPACGKALRKSETEFYCWKKQNGCGKTYSLTDPTLKSAPTVENESAEDQWTLQSSIDFFRATAESSSEYAGQEDALWCGPDGKWVDVWLSDTNPTAARIGVLRNNFVQPLRSVALFKEYYGDGAQSVFAKRMPAAAIAKCAEALAIRRAFPSKLSGIYIAEEMEQADRVIEKTVEALPAPAQALPAAHYLIPAQSAEILVDQYVNEALPVATIAPTVQTVSTVPAEMEAVRLIGKQLGKLAGAVNADLQKLGGDVLALKQEYERQLANKNPRGAQASAAVSTEHKKNDGIQEAPSAVVSSGNAEGDNQTPRGEAVAEAPPSTAPVSDDAVKPGGGATSSKADADFAFAASELMGAFDRSSMKDFCFQDRMEFCAMYLKKEVAQYSDMSPEECDLVREYINSDMQHSADGERIYESDLKKIQAELKDADFVAWLQKSKTYQNVLAEMSHTDALRIARLAWAKNVLLREIESFKELTPKEGRILTEKFKEMKKK